MRLSIIIPVYNVEAYVGKALESVFDTDAPTEEFEVIVVNDGTEDDSMSIVRRYEDRTNMTILEQENQGLSAARMRGLSEAKGEYIWFVDSDDYLFKDGVGKVLDYLVNREGADVLVFPLLRIFDDTAKNGLDYKIEHEFHSSGKSIIRNGVIPLFNISRYVFKRSLMESKWLFFPEGLIHEDEYFAPVLMCLADNVSVLPDAVYVHIHRQGSIMTTLGMRSSYDLTAIHELLMKFMKENVPENEQSAFRKYCMNRLSYCYINNSRRYGTPEFNAFVRARGMYVWHQWCKAFPDSSMAKKTRRLMHFMMPGLSERVSAGA